MKRLLILVLMVAALGLQTSVAQSADATAAWNHVAAQYNFDTTAGSGLGGTFAQSYTGTDFDADFADILDAVAQLMGTTVPRFNGNDVMNTSLQNWPDS